MTGRGGIVAIVLAAACVAPPPPPAWTLRTIDDLGSPAVVPPGGRLRLLSTPFAITDSFQKAGQTGLTVFPAFAEGDTAAYMTTEVWQNFDQIWVQPLYLPLTTLDPAQPFKLAAPAIFGVDSTSRFYSPYWQIYSYANPPGANFKSTKEVLDSGVKLVPGSGKFCPITRDRTALPAQAAGATPVRPLSGEKIVPVQNFPGYAEGNDIFFVELFNWGLNVFTWNYDTLVVDETPLFTFQRVNSSGDNVTVDLPSVAGTGKLHHPTCDGHGKCLGLQSNGIPQFGALWRIYSAVLPPTADVFVPGSSAQVDVGALRSYMQSQGFAAPIPAYAGADADKYTLRVTTTPAACFLDVHAANCIWLDSQNAIEANLPDFRITETATSVSCPLVRFNGLPK